MIPLPLIVVCALVALSILVAVVVLAVKLRRSSCPVAVTADADLEEAAPVRRVRVRRGRVVSWASTVKYAKDFTKWPASPKCSSRRSSWSSLPRTIDLEKDIEALKKDFDDNDNQDASRRASSKLGLYPIKESEQPPVPPLPAYLGGGSGEKSAAVVGVTALEPSDRIVESSWETYNGHRPRDHVLSTHIEHSPLAPNFTALIRPPSAEDEDDVSIRPPPPSKSPSKSRSHDTLRKPAGEFKTRPSRYSHPAPAMEQSAGRSFLAAPGPGESFFSSTATLTIETTSEIPPPPLPADGPQRKESTNRWTVMSEEEAMYLAHRRTMTPAAPKPRRPPRLDLQLSSPTALEYGFPSPPPSSSVLSPRSPPSPHRFSRLYSGDTTPRTALFPGPDFMDLESQASGTPSRSHSRSRSMSRSRSASRSARGASRSQSHRVSKRPPQPPISPSWLATAQETTFYDSPSISDASPVAPKPSAVDKSSAAAIETTNNNAHRFSTQTFQSGDLSPTFQVAPVFRVPVLAGKGSNSPRVTVLEPSEGGSGGDPKKRSSGNAGARAVAPMAKRATKKTTSKKPKPLSVQQVAAEAKPEDKVSAWTPTDIQSMLVRAHGMAQSMEPITPTDPKPNTVELPANSKLEKSSGLRHLSGGGAASNRPLANTKVTRKEVPLTPTTPGTSSGGFAALAAAAARGRSKSDNSMLEAARSANTATTSTVTARHSHLNDKKALPPLPLPPSFSAAQPQPQTQTQPKKPQQQHLQQHHPRSPSLPHTMATTTKTPYNPDGLKRQSSTAVSALSSPIGREGSGAGFVSDMTSGSNSPVFVSAARNKRGSGRRRTAEERLSLVGSLISPISPISAEFPPPTNNARI